MPFRDFSFPLQSLLVWLPLFEEKHLKELIFDMDNVLGCGSQFLKSVTFCSVFDVTFLIFGLDVKMSKLKCLRSESLIKLTMKDEYDQVLDFMLKCLS